MGSIKYQADISPQPGEAAGESGWGALGKSLGSAFGGGPDATQTPSYQQGASVGANTSKAMADAALAQQKYQLIAKGTAKDPETLAAMHAAGVPVGLEDQYLSAVGQSDDPSKITNSWGELQKTQALKNVGDPTSTTANRELQMLIAGHSGKDAQLTQEVGSSGELTTVGGRPPLGTDLTQSRESVAKTDELVAKAGLEKHEDTAPGAYHPNMNAALPDPSDPDYPAYIKSLHDGDQPPLTGRAAISPAGLRINMDVVNYGKPGHMGDPNAQPGVAPGVAPAAAPAAAPVAAPVAAHTAAPPLLGNTIGGVKILSAAELEKMSPTEKRDYAARMSDAESGKPNTTVNDNAPAVAPGAVNPIVAAAAQGANPNAPAPAALTAATAAAPAAKVNPPVPTYNAGLYAAHTKAYTDWTDPNGIGTKKIQSANTLVNHTDLADQMVDALEKTPGVGNIPLWNKWELGLNHAVGGTAPTNFAAVKEVVGPEMVNLIAQAGGAEPERTAAKSLIDNANTPPQLHEALDIIRGIAAGRVEPLRTAYETGVGNTLSTNTPFTSLLAERTQQVLRDQAAKGRPTGAQIFADEPSAQAASAAGTLKKDERIIVGGRAAKWGG